MTEKRQNDMNAIEKIGLAKRLLYIAEQEAISIDNYEHEKARCRKAGTSISWEIKQPSKEYVKTICKVVRKIVLEVSKEIETI